MQRRGDVIQVIQVYFFFSCIFVLLLTLDDSHFNLELFSQHWVSLSTELLGLRGLDLYNKFDNETDTLRFLDIQ